VSSFFYYIDGATLLATAMHKKGCSGVPLGEGYLLVLDVWTVTRLLDERGLCSNGWIE
jgi:hypothetical protein